MLSYFFFSIIMSFAYSQGDTLTRSFVHGDSLRSYILYLPGAYDGSTSWPLVINIHGYTMSGEGQMNVTRMNALADSEHFLVAYPNGSTVINKISHLKNTLPPPGLGFHVGGPKEKQFYSPGRLDEVDFISRLIDDIAANHKVDEQRIYATGYSNGAMLSTILAAELGHRIAAIAAVGGTIPTSRTLKASRAVPVLFIHGTADSLALYDQESNMLTVPKLIQYWVNQNNCAGTPTVEQLPDLDKEDKSKVELLTWQNCAQPVKHLKIINGGHHWPGKYNSLPFPILGNFNKDIDTNVEVWNFFKQHALN